MSGLVHTHSRINGEIFPGPLCFWTTPIMWSGTTPSQWVECEERRCHLGTEEGYPDSISAWCCWPVSPLLTHNRERGSAEIC